MKHPFRSNILPFFTMGAGVLGLALRICLFSAIDEKGLLPVNHWAGIALFLLSGLVLGILFLSTRQLSPVRLNRKFLRISCAAAYGAGTLGLIFAAIGYLRAGAVRLSIPAAVACLIGALVLLLMGFFKAMGRKLPYWLPAILTVMLMVDTVAQCQVWGSTPQLQEYFFSLLASVFLVLTGYHKTVLAAGSGKRPHLAFFSQGALFFCCLCLNGGHWPMYLGMLFWAGAQLYPCLKKEG